MVFQNFELFPHMRIVELYIFVAVVYFIICFGASWGVKKLNEKISVAK